MNNDNFERTYLYGRNYWFYHRIQKAKQEYEKLYHNEKNNPYYDKILFQYAQFLLKRNKNKSKLLFEEIINHYSNSSYYKDALVYLSSFEVDSLKKLELLQKVDNWDSKWYLRRCFY